MLEDLHIGTAVTTNDGARAGTLSRVVMDGPSDKIVSVVVDPGLVESGNLLAPGGWERPRERVVPISLVASASRASVELTCTPAEFQAMPLFEQQQYTSFEPAADSPAHARFDRDTLLAYAASEFGLGGAPYVPPMIITHIEPPTSGAIGENTPVWRTEPHERIGEVERVLLDSATQRVSALVLRRGLLRHHVVLPVSAITSVEDDLVRVQLTDAELDALAPYTAEQ